MDIGKDLQRAFDDGYTQAIADIKLAHKPKTNADRIRAMTDEELAKFIERSDCPPHNGTCDNDNISCTKCWLDWLQSPSDGGDHNAVD